MVTIISTNYMAYDYLELNYKLLSRYKYISWIIIDNSPIQQKILFPHILLPRAEYKENITESFVNKHSYSHSAALNSAIPHIKTDYVLFLDPDFFIIYDFDKILQYMDNNKLDVFGSPYFPEQNRNRFYNIPVAFNMFVNTKSVDISNWSFTPTGIESDGLIGDTGISIYRDIKAKYKYECTKPVKVNGIDYYLWNNKIYGIHQHAKLHLKSDEQRKLIFHKLKKELKV